MAASSSSALGMCCRSQSLGQRPKGSPGHCTPPCRRLLQASLTACSDCTATTGVECQPTLLWCQGTRKLLWYDVCLLQEVVLQPGAERPVPGGTYPRWQWRSEHNKQHAYSSHQHQSPPGQLALAVLQQHEWHTPNASSQKQAAQQERFSGPAPVQALQHLKQSKSGMEHRSSNTCCLYQALQAMELQFKEGSSLCSGMLNVCHSSERI